MLFKVLRFILSILLIPGCVAITVTFYKGIIGIQHISESGLIFILGALSYSLVHLLLFRPNFFYVIGHELLHASATLLSGGKVQGLKASIREGSIRVTSPNLFVMIAPYLIPFWTVFIALLYFFISFFIDGTRYSGLFIFLIGFTLMFHLVYTAQSIKERQSDLIKAGYFCSIFSIYIFNLGVVFFIVSIFFKEASFLDFLFVFYEEAKRSYFSLWQQLSL